MGEKSDKESKTIFISEVTVIANENFPKITFRFGKL